jgi:hypothetical protein
MASCSAPCLRVPHRCGALVRRSGPPCQDQRPLPAGTAAAAWMFFAAWAVLMSAVDWESTLLPDVMTIPLI